MKLNIAGLKFSLITLCFFVAKVGQTEVIDVASAGFTSSHQIYISASPEKVYQALTQRVSQWWSSDHTYSGDAKYLSIAAEAGGCFCEIWPGGSVEHMRIAYADANKALRMIGGLGPLQSLAVQGSINWTLTTETLAEGKIGTRLVVVYRVGGYLNGGLESWSQPVDRVLGEQIDRLKAYIEK